MKEFELCLEQKLKRLAKESENELRKIGLSNKIKSNITYKVNYRAKRRLGQCCNKKDINISSWVLEIGTDKDIKNVIIHEILHTFNDTIGHKAKWQYYARYVNKNTEYSITTYANIKEIMNRNGVKKEQEQDLMGYNYEIICGNCNATWYKRRLNKTTIMDYKRNGRWHRTCGCHNLIVKDLRTNKIIVGG